MDTVLAAKDTEIERLKMQLREKDGIIAQLKARYE